MRRTAGCQGIVMVRITIEYSRVELISATIVSCSTLCTVFLWAAPYYPLFFIRADTVTAAAVGLSTSYALSTGQVR